MKIVEVTKQRKGEPGSNLGKRSWPSESANVSTTKSAEVVAAQSVGTTVDAVASRIMVETVVSEENGLPCATTGSSNILEGRGRDGRPAKVPYPQGQTLPKQPNILELFDEALGQISVIGEGRAAKLLYLAVTSRFLERPVSIVVKGVSSGGKSYLVEQVLRFFPHSAYCVLTTMSDKALAYSEEPIRHRFLVIHEATGQQSQWASYLIRSLLSEGRISYDTVEVTEDGIKPKHIEREGPTGLITTTTENSLHPENETRYFSVDVDDTPEQTSRVLLATAENINKGNGGNGEEEIGKFRALQEWLAGSNHKVVIPYAKRLAELIPPVAPRLRRDFKAVLHLIMSHAILQQASRAQDDRGRIIATIEDYKVVWDLVAPTVSRGVQMTVSATMRETVQAVKKLEQETGEGLKGDRGDVMAGASLMDVANILHLNRSTVSRRVSACLEEGYLVNRETKRGQPFRLVVGDPLPDDAEVLPTPESRLSVAVLQLIRRV